MSERATAAEILLIEDDAAILEGLAECLALEGHSVHAASDGVDGLAWLAAGNRPRLVVLDLVMPRMSGDEFLREARGRSTLAEVPVILMTAAAPGKVKLPEVDAVLTKPFELDALLEVVRGLLG